MTRPSEKSYTCWTIKECPLRHECSVSAWAKSKKCKSFTSEDDCRQLCLEHLQTSGKHWETVDKDILDNAAFVEAIVDQDEVAAHWFDNQPAVKQVRKMGEEDEKEKERERRSCSLKRRRT